MHYPVIHGWKKFLKKVVSLNMGKQGIHERFFATTCEKNLEVTFGKNMGAFEKNKGAVG